MQKSSILSLTVWHLPILLALGAAPAAIGQNAGDASEFPAAVKFETGAAEFYPGDNITIESVRGTSSTIRTGETYCVEGTYTLASKDKADLALFATTTTRVAVPTDPKQIMRVERGSGHFRLVKRMGEEGYLHISFYPVPGGSSFGGVYFGQGQWVLRQKPWSDLKQYGGLEDFTTVAGARVAALALAPQNQVLLKYLGEPVAPPEHMESAYTKAGLIKGIQTAAQKAGVTVQRIEIEDSEYPFLVGLVCKKGGIDKVTDQLRKMPDYSYNGSHSTSTHAVFNIVPYNVFPSNAAERIGHRTGLRLQMFLDHILRQG